MNNFLNDFFDPDSGMFFIVLINALALAFLLSLDYFVKLVFKSKKHKKSRTANNSSQTKNPLISNSSSSSHPDQSTSQVQTGSESRETPQILPEPAANETKLYIKVRSNLDILESESDSLKHQSTGSSNVLDSSESDEITPLSAEEFLAIIDKLTQTHPYPLKKDEKTSIESPSPIEQIENPEPIDRAEFITNDSDRIPQINDIPSIDGTNGIDATNPNDNNGGHCTSYPKVENIPVAYPTHFESKNVLKEDHHEVFSQKSSAIKRSSTFISSKNAVGDSFKASKAFDFLEQTVLVSAPNQTQNDDTCINYIPDNSLQQQDPYKYPVIKVPALSSFLLLPRLGRSDNRGFKENDFFNLLNKSILGIETSNDFHLPIPYFNKPYEPDMVVYSPEKGFYLDIEIDEPYDGYFRYPTHFIEGNDGIRDKYFCDNGWCVVRFTEKQIHEHPEECINFIKTILFRNSILVDDAQGFPPLEEQWTYDQAITWQKNFYRESYLGINGFKKHLAKKRVIVDAWDGIDVQHPDRRLLMNEFSTIKAASIEFEEENHTYAHPFNTTGTGDFLSVTTLIDRFFPFDINSFLGKKMEETGRSKEDLLGEYVAERDLAASKGTFLHKQIENFLKNKSYDDSLPEFQQFLDFYNEVILKNKFVFIESEKIIFLRDLGLAGTIDALFKKADAEEYIIFDWKRSKKLTIDGHARIFGFGFANADLSHLDNSSYYKYVLQQNLYKFMLKTQFGINVSSMHLVVLHETLPKYTRLSVPDKPNEVQILLKSIDHKI